ncbi:hypothetical protein A2W48_02945 [Candidatus Giovannonibacteria bacterium RIFCSPHIGHO2_12_44_12]|uniref:inosine/xanthosine triphosphatase n=2 Tax=Candidatus Giovannoniibacteriota TaxID=1752738 RepID=A0A1F5X010_9BACT|nr:MAG: putative non-canonical purine NTP phosphatase [Parcubacteria group bacterium GW2011_GWA2_47_21]OGF74328.1 MAG: hypothetical protein A2W57_00185 [Candidatus Giovannonibacteria bacterium RIFCSPHIGHO2_02_43_16]OGF81209.1 MAG: hypothetical protein A2W48_02945 [Candidatus Giovannonibacteria bacterium RIFCSPHIGHO2_12_44_12]
MRIVAIGSARDEKRQAVEIAFSRMLPNEFKADEWKFVCVPVDSGVGNQPGSDVQGACGAETRAWGAFNGVPDVEFGIGIEGCISAVFGKHWFSRTWAVVRSIEGSGMGSGPSVWVQPELHEYIRKGNELGEVIEKTSRIPNARYTFGHIGLMTRNVVTRLEEDVMAVQMALAALFHQKG